MRHRSLARFIAVAILFSVELISAFATQPAAKANAKAAQNTTQANRARLPQVHLDGTYFTRNGKRFIPVGAHWVPAKAAMQWPVQWDPKDIEADFAKMHELGYSIVRFDMMWSWFEPRPGDYNRVAFQQLDYLVSLAHKYQIYLHPSLFIGGEVGEAYWDVAWRHGRHPHADPEMLRLETNLATEFGRRYANESAIIGWDLTDEPPFWIVGGAATTDAMAVNWTRLIVDGIRQFDKLHPIVVGTSGEEITHGPFRADNIAKFVTQLLRGYVRNGLTRTWLQHICQHHLRIGIAVRTRIYAKRTQSTMYSRRWAGNNSFEPSCRRQQ